MRSSLAEGDEGSSAMRSSLENQACSSDYSEKFEEEEEEESKSQEIIEEDSAEEEDSEYEEDSEHGMLYWANRRVETMLLYVLSLKKHALAKKRRGDIRGYRNVLT